MKINADANSPAEPTSRERASKWVYAVHKWRGMSPAFMQTQVSRLEAQFDAVAKAAKLGALEKLEVREMRVALQRTANNDEGLSDCECECGDDPDCCEKVDEWCPHCIAQTALQKAALKEEA